MIELKRELEQKLQKEQIEQQRQKLEELRRQSAEKERKNNELRQERMRLEQEKIRDQEIQAEKERQLKEAMAKAEVNQTLAKSDRPVHIPENLELNCQSKNLVKVFININQALNFYNSRGMPATFSKIQEFVEKNTQREFTINSFRQILTLVPNFFNHKWEHHKGKMELVISIPANIMDIVASHSPF